LIPFALSTVILLLYARTGGYGFVYYDDVNYISRNPAVQDGLTLDGVLWAFSSFDQANWHPLTWLSHMADVSLFGMAPGRHHLVNVIFHVLNTGLLYHLFRRMTGKVFESALVAALFAVHPLHVESVAWLAERKDVLSTFFGLLTMIAYGRYASRPGAGRYIGVLLLFGLGLMSKPMLVTLPFVLLLLDDWPLGRTAKNGASLPRLVLEKIPMIAMSAAASAATISAQISDSAVGSIGHFPLGIRVANALNAYALYLSKALWPSNLAVFYPHPLESLSTARIIGSGVLLVAITVLAISQARTRSWLTVGWLWFIGTLVPVIGLVQVGGQAMADRYTYIPMIGLFVVAAWGGSELVNRWRIRAPVVAFLAAAWLVALSVCTWFQVGYWRGPVPLFAHTLDATRDNWLAHLVLGDAALDSGDDRSAVLHFREAARIRSGYAETHMKIGMADARQGRDADAEVQFREVLRFHPEDTRAQILLSETLSKTAPRGEDAALDAAGHTRVGMALAGKGSLGEALGHFRAALALRPDDPEAHYNLAVALGRLGKKEESLRHFREATRIRPIDSDACKKIGLALVRLGRLTEALPRFREAIRLAPDDPEAQYNVGATLMQLGRPSEAIAHFRIAVRESGGSDADAMLALGTALEASGQVEESRERYRDVLRLKPGNIAAMDRLEKARKPVGE
jgi:Flp pilus assembly protein TadD